MKINSISIDEVKEKFGNYQYSLVYSISKRFWGKTTEMDAIDWNEVTEAYFFNDKEQIHVYVDNGLCAVKISDEDGDNYIIKTYKTDIEFTQIGTQVLVKEYLDSDEDGQTYVSYTRLYGIS